MKKVLSISLLFLTVFLFYNCKKETTAKVPVLSTTPASNVTATTATGGGSISSDGGAAISVRGVCWGLTTDPTTADSKTTDGEGTGQFVSSIDNLNGGTTYHVRAYATNSAGTAYGDDLTFTTLGQVPAATTQAATNLSATGATLNGTVNANDLSTTVTFEYGTTTDYGQTTAGSPGQVTGNTSTIVSAVLTGLTPGTTYHFRIKAVNSVGITYSSDMVFSTTGLVPIVTTLAAINISATGATLSGSANANGLTTTVIFEYGTTASYGQNATPTFDQITGNSNIAEYATITGLTQNTTYHFRIKAVNSAGTTYGSDLTFATLNSATQVADIDGNIYNIITIGTQVWLQENLKTTKYNDGTAIPNVTDNTAWSTTTSDAYCDYANTPANSTIYGRLYNWYAVGSTNPKNVCPTGWHVATDADWTALATYLGGETVAGGKLKETGTTHWAAPNTGATNETGFTALPGGYRAQSGSFGLSGTYGFWWTATEGGATFAFYRYMFNTSASLSSGDNDKHGGFYVRCAKN
jgi:uncharacterized protein (TIGR02145 family)